MNAEAAILRAQLAAVKKERDEFRNAILGHQWAGWSETYQERECPFCEHQITEGHMAGCIVSVAKASLEASRG